MKNKRDYYVDVFRVISSIMVIAIHTEPFEEFGEIYHFIIKKMLCAVAVPFFFAISGYYFFNKLAQKKENVFLEQLIKIIKPYLLWSIIYIIVDIYRKIIVGSMSTDVFLIDLANNFFINGTYYHLWFIPALIFSLSLCYFIYLKNEKLLTCFGFLSISFSILAYAYYYVGIRIPFIGLLMETNFFLKYQEIICAAFPSYSLGFLIFKFRKKFDNKVVNKYLLFASMFFVLESFFVYRFNLYKKSIYSATLYIFVFFIIVKLLCLKGESDSKYLRFLSSFNYYSHALFIVIYKLIFPRIGQTLLFVAVTISCLLVGMIICKVNNKYINYFL